jgi:hypothetical protein
MKTIAKRFPLFFVSAGLLALGIWLSLPVPIRGTSQATHVIEITAKKYEYSTSPVRVKLGTKVQLKITAIDHDHGFKIGSDPDGTASSGTQAWSLTRNKNVGS